MAYPAGTMYTLISSPPEYRNVSTTVRGMIRAIALAGKHRAGSSAAVVDGCRWVGRLHP